MTRRPPAEDDPEPNDAAAEDQADADEVEPAPPARRPKSAKPSPKRLPTNRDTRMKEALLAYLYTGSYRKAEAECGVPYRTIASWAQSPAGQHIIAELKKTIGDEIGDDLLRIEKKLLKKYEAALDSGDIGGRDIPVHFGIYFDKRMRICGKGEQGMGGGGDITVRVVFGSGRESDGPPMLEGTAIEVREPDSE